MTKEMTVDEIAAELEEFEVEDEFEVEEEVAPVKRTRKTTVDKEEVKAAREAAKAAAKEAKAALIEQRKAEKEAAKAAKAAEKEAAKVPKVVMPEQNGVVRPKPETLCGQAWACCDEASANRGEPASIQEVLEIAIDRGLNLGNVKVEYARWKKFHGLSGRILSQYAIKEKLEKAAEKEAAKAAREAAKLAKAAEKAAEVEVVNGTTSLL